MSGRIASARHRRTILSLALAPGRKALSFFDDGDLRQLPDDMKLRLVTAARNVDLDHLPSLDNPTRKIDQDHGHEL